jgi:cystathionine beta-lyase/cystathionine gamma-synthase
MQKQQENALQLAHWLCTQPKITAVHYAGLPTHPDYEVSVRQATGFGAMISFETNNEQTAGRLLEKVRLIKFAESLGGTETLITYPMLQTHADVPKEVREAKGINERLIRLSAGLEFAGDLIADLKQALEG